MDSKNVTRTARCTLLAVCIALLPAPMHSARRKVFYTVGGDFTSAHGKRHGGLNNEIMSTVGQCESIALSNQ